MEKMIVKVSLENTDEKNCNLKFKFSDKDIIIDLYDDNMDQLKTLFTKVMKELIFNDISFSFNKDEYGDYKNRLALDACVDYIEQLNIDINALLESQNLKDIRNDYINTDEE